MIKRYIADNINIATEMAKAEIGLDAMFLYSRKIRQPGFWGFFKKPVLEVFFSYEPNDKSRDNDIDQLKTLVEELSDKMDNLAKQEHKTVLENDDLDKSVFQNKSKEYIDYCIKMGLNPAIAKKIVEIVSRQISLDSDNRQTVINAIKIVSREYLGDIKNINQDFSTSPKIYVFVGPTGVGKTTTLSKIAANLSFQNKKVSIITLDTYRIAAADQIKTYSQILNAPIEVVYDARGLKDTIEKFTDSDYILVDTAGRNHKSDELRQDFEGLIDHIKNPKFFLLLSMTTDYNDLKNIISAYSFLPDYWLLFTKLDEANSFANILNVKIMSGRSLSYFAIGQEVPDDLINANKEMIIEQVFKSFEESNNGSSSQA